jgi:hypothetical protein
VRGSRARWPWEKQQDPRDTHRLPVAFHERIRIGIKGATVLVAFLFVRESTENGIGIGSKIALAFGAVLVVFGVMDLLWTRRGLIDHIFVESHAAQIKVHAATAIGGALIVIAAAARLT